MDLIRGYYTVMPQMNNVVPFLLPSNAMGAALMYAPASGRGRDFGVRKQQRCGSVKFYLKPDTV